MTDVLGLDSASLIPIGPARAAGYTVICGYIGRGYITKAYIDAVFASGGVFFPIYETDGTPDGYDDGARQGAVAAADLQRLGYPQLGCAFTDDVSGRPWSVVDPWCRGIASTFHAFRVYYGPTQFGARLVADGTMGATWVEGAWSFSTPYVPGQPPRQSPDQCGLQYPRYVYPGGTQCDYNVFYSMPWLDGPTPGGDTLSAAEVAEINANTNAGFAAMQAQLGTWMQEQSANVVAALTKTITANSYNSRRFAFRIGSSPDAWLVSFDAQGATRTHIPDQATEQALVDIGAISPVLDIDVTDEAKAAALLQIREVPWRPLGA